jgi:hypothetical protein
MTTPHSNGDWAVSEWGDHEIDIYAGDKHICELIVSDDSEASLAESAANARLIAASPDLLAALHGVLHWAECECWQLPQDETPCDYCTAVAAIAKAEGGDK